MLFSSVERSESDFHIHIPLPFGLSSDSAHHSVLSRVLCVLGSIFALVIYFIHGINSVYVLIPVSQLLLPPTFSLNHAFVFVTVLATFNFGDYSFP